MVQISHSERWAQNILIWHPQVHDTDQYPPGTFFTYSALSFSLGSHRTTHDADVETGELQVGTASESCK